ncbi:hypothetical protein C8Q75DRAFT_737350 [Abortiporus biennis]|nr:hypothetical protein C8Q75DRAFT_737350 [Abortiporus biennis]
MTMRWSNIWLGWHSKMLKQLWDALDYEKQEKWDVHAEHAQLGKGMDKDLEYFLQCNHSVILQEVAMHFAHIISTLITIFSGYKAIQDSTLSTCFHAALEGKPAFKEVSKKFSLAEWYVYIEKYWGGEGMMFLEQELKGQNLIEFPFDENGYCTFPTTNLPTMTIARLVIKAFLDRLWRDECIELYNFWRDRTLAKKIPCVLRAWCIENTRRKVHKFEPSKFHPELHKAGMYNDDDSSDDNDNDSELNPCNYIPEGLTMATWDNKQKGLVDACTGKKIDMNKEPQSCSDPKDIIPSPLFIPDSDDKSSLSSQTLNQKASDHLSKGLFSHPASYSNSEEDLNFSLRLDAELDPPVHSSHDDPCSDSVFHGDMELATDEERRDWLWEGWNCPHFTSAVSYLFKEKMLFLEPTPAPTIPWSTWSRISAALPKKYHVIIPMAIKWLHHCGDYAVLAESLKRPALEGESSTSHSHLAQNGEWMTRKAEEKKREYEVGNKGKGKAHIEDSDYDNYHPSPALPTTPPQKQTHSLTPPTFRSANQMMEQRQMAFSSFSDVDNDWDFPKGLSSPQFKYDKLSPNHTPKTLPNAIFWTSGVSNARVQSSKQTLLNNSDTSGMISLPKKLNATLKKKPASRT